MFWYLVGDFWFSILNFLNILSKYKNLNEISIYDNDIEKVRENLKELRDRKIKIIESTIPLIKNQYLEPVKLCVEGINDTLNRIYRDLDKIQHNYNIFTDKKKYIERVKKNSENLDRQFTDLLHLMNLKN